MFASLFFASIFLFGIVLATPILQTTLGKVSGFTKRNVNTYRGK
jgi:hypothetical protein